MLACHGSLYRYARTLARDPAVAEELVQETYRRALAAKKWPYPPTEECLRPWLFTIARNHWHNEVHRARAARFEELDEEISGESAETPDSLLLRRLLQSEIRDAVDALPESFREVIVLREIENLSYEEIARLLECPVGTVMSRLSRARARLRRTLAFHAGPREGKPL